MTPRVHILASCPTPDALPYTLLVFDTLRVGFPTADIMVNVNGKSGEQEVAEACRKAGVECAPCGNTIHHEWIDDLFDYKTEPFWLCDTDMVFYAPVEGWTFDAPMAGWRIPEWRDDFSRCITRPRLHTSLMWIDPMRVHTDLAKFNAELPQGPFTPFVNPVYPLVIPFKGQRYFYDTCSMLYHAIGGQAFMDAQKEAYFHANFGTIESLVLPRLPDAARMKAARDAVLKDHSLGRGMWREQEAYYANHQV